MADAALDDALKFVLRWEGGFVDHPVAGGAAVVVHAAGIHQHRPGRGHVPLRKRRRNDVRQ